MTLQKKTPKKHSLPKTRGKNKRKHTHTHIHLSLQLTFDGLFSVVVFFVLFLLVPKKSKKKTSIEVVAAVKSGALKHIFVIGGQLVLNPSLDSSKVGSFDEWQFSVG